MILVYCLTIALGINILGVLLKIYNDDKEAEKQRQETDTYNGGY